MDGSYQRKADSTAEAILVQACEAAAVQITRGIRQRFAATRPKAQQL